MGFGLLASKALRATSSLLLSSQNPTIFLRTIVSNPQFCNPEASAAQPERPPRTPGGYGFMAKPDYGMNRLYTDYMHSVIKFNVYELTFQNIAPVGALTSKLFAFKARNMEFKDTETIDFTDFVGSNI
ncbi:hypothetical protein VNO80_04681 [Phaseolus coccineus]|uniref:Uncharacterized protein n=1 Tax=Phaseolus coccineus TaxID=3886 RepID=A0AAN9NU70_PHACN